ncbi:hypothetical protein [Devosia sp.]|uniref:hypothetical protein n=1 Tax=Devosia sp. TaxID=1871048 RepID=UPI003A8E06D6
MTLTKADIPSRFWTVRYVAASIPEREPYDLSNGANCQLFAYALLAHFGHAVPPFRSSNLWDDKVHTEHVEQPYTALDLLLFAPQKNAWGAHLAVAMGPHSAIHLSHRIGQPVIWPLDRFQQEADYRILLGAKRLRQAK